MIAAQVTGEDLCLHAMHLLDAAGTARLDTFLSESAEARAELERIRGDLALLAFTADPKPVSHGLRQRLQREIAREPKGDRSMPSQSGDRPERAQTLTSDLADGLLTQDSYTPAANNAQPAESGREAFPVSTTSARVWLWTGWALAVGLTVCGGWLYTDARGLRVRLKTAEAKAGRAAEIERTTSIASANANAILDALRSRASQRFLVAPPGVVLPGVAHAAYSPERGALVLEASGLQALGPGKVYAVWLFLMQEDSLPELVGTAQPDAHGFVSVAVSSLPPGVLAERVGITVEDEGAPPTVPSATLLTGSQLPAE